MISVDWRKFASAVESTLWGSKGSGVGLGVGSGVVSGAGLSDAGASVFTTVPLSAGGGVGLHVLRVRAVERHVAPDYDAQRHHEQDHQHGLQYLLHMVRIVPPPAAGLSRSHFPTTSDFCISVLLPVPDYYSVKWTWLLMWSWQKQ